MKKLFVLFALILFTTTVFSQVTGREVKTYYIATETTKLPYNIEPGNLLYVGSTGNTYLAASIAKAGRTPATLKAAATISLAAVANSSYYVDTATSQNVRGIKTFYSAPNISIVGSGGSTTFTNLGVGEGVLTHVTTGEGSVAIGKNALHTMVIAQGNTAVGYEAGKLSTGTANTFLGYLSGNVTSSGIGNTFVGYGSGSNNTTAGGGTFIGYGAGALNTTATNCIVIGKDAGSKVLYNGSLVISNKVGGADTAIIYGIMGATPAASTLQLNSTVQTPQGLTITTSDTITDAAVGTFCYRVADSTMYLKIRMTGTKAARWKKLY